MYRVHPKKHLFRDFLKDCIIIFYKTVFEFLVFESFFFKKKNTLKYGILVDLTF